MFSLIKFKNMTYILSFYCSDLDLASDKNDEVSVIKSQAKVYDFM